MLYGHALANTLTDRTSPDTMSQNKLTIFSLLHTIVVAISSDFLLVTSIKLSLIPDILSIFDCR